MVLSAGDGVVVNPQSHNLILPNSVRHRHDGRSTTLNRWRRQTAHNHGHAAV